MLRTYQLDAVNAVYNHLRTRTDNPLVVIPTGGGKTHVIKKIVEDAVDQWSGRVLILAHVKELLKQAAEKLDRPDVGIYSAGLGSRDTDSKILIAGIQSVYQKAGELGPFNLILVDECFVAGTIVSTPSGGMPIESIQPGMTVHNADGIGKVIAVSAKPSSDLVTLEYSDGTTITCTTNHPFFTERGWVSAGLLEIGSSAYGIEDLRGMQQAVLSVGENPDGRTSFVPERKALDEATILFNLLLENSQQLHGVRGSEGQGQPVAQGDQSPTQGSRWQWPDDPVAIDDSLRSRESVGFRTFRSCAGLSVDGSAEESQDRPCESNNPNCNRAGRGQPSIADPAWARHEEGRVFGSRRLVGISHHQCESDRAVYNLHVSGSPTYFANGVLVHNCHLIPLEGDGMYQQFLKDAKLVNPSARVVGLTATPYRMKEGTIADPDHFLNHVCYEASIQELIQLGYLCDVRSKAGKKKPDTDSLHVRGGEYIASEVADLMDTDQLVDAAVSEILDLTKDRHSVLVFAASVKHAMHLQTLLPDAGLVVGETAAGERDEQIEEFKLGERKFLVSVNVLSVGFDAPNVDAIAMLRPTLSPGLYYQQVGRGLRLHPSKADCLVLDFAGNIKRHGPIDAMKIRPGGSGSGQGQPAPTKECPVCMEIVLAAYSKCPECEHEFTQDKPKHGSQADDAAILSSQQPPEVWRVNDVFYCVHTKKDADEFTPKTLRVDYLCGIGVKISEWVCVEHEGFALEKARAWWAAHSNDPFPQSAQHAVDIAQAGGVARPEEITVIREGKWPRVSDRKLGPKPEAVNVEHLDMDEVQF